MTNNKKVISCTSIEQSRKLVELGLDPDTCDMAWNKIDVNAYAASNITVEGWKFSIQGKVLNQIPNNCIPAWSLTKMLSLIPAIIIFNGEEANFCLSYGDDKQPSAYYNNKLGNELIQFTGENFQVAAYGLMCWLLENAYIK